MRLGDFIIANMEAILVEWENFARSLAPGSTMSVMALRDHAEAILRLAARDMASPQTSAQRSSKSKGHGGGGEESDRLDAASAEHALLRLGSGFNLIEVVSEYRALRASVLDLWRKRVQHSDERDLEDLTRFNESIDQSLAEAVRSYTERVDDSRELFVATLSHDLRAPLNAMMLSAQVLERSGQLNGEHALIASRMTGYGKTMTNMIHDLLDFTQTRLGKGIPVDVAPVDLAAVCREVIDECRATHPGADIRFTCDADVNGSWDAARLRQVLSNLVNNALQHGEPAGEVEVKASDAGDEVLLTVRNRGPKIPESSLPTLFDPFVRAALRPDAPRSGFGLGLFISRAIVMAHSGTITVESSDANGALFTVRLPRTPAPESDPYQ